MMKREWRIRHANGAWLTVDNVGTNLLSEPVIRGIVLNTRDVTEQSMIKQQYMHQAFHDPLTDLANRSLFLYQVGHALARAQSGDRIALDVEARRLDLLVVRHGAYRTRRCSPSPGRGRVRLPALAS